MTTPGRPGFVQLYPTLRCNRACGFCFNRGVEAYADIEIRDFEKLVETLLELGVKEIDLLGGEPTLLPEFPRMADIIHKTGLKASLSTNGSNVGALKDLAIRCPASRIKTGVSINAPLVSPELHAYIARHKPMLKSVCNHTGRVPAAAKGYLGVKGLEFYFIYMDAISREDVKMTMPFYEYLEKLESLKTGYSNVEGVHCGFLPAYGLLGVRCPAGTAKLSVLPDGSAYPCYLFFRHREFRLGNILKDDFQAIWKSPVLDYFRQFDGNPCPYKKCKLLSLCRGGCPAVSLLVTGDPDAPDPRCVR